MIDEYIKDICNILNIYVPKVSNDISHFNSDTMMAQCSRGTLHIRKEDNPNPDYLFAIAHELRHMWQLKNDKDYYFSNYQTVDKIGVNRIVTH